MQQHFTILGTGSLLPGPGIDAATFERRLNLPPGWIGGHTHVKQRYECVPPETVVSMARKAIRRALDDAGLDWTSIELLIDCSTSRSQPIPGNAPVVLEQFLPEARGIPGMDVHSTCLGFLLGLNVANALIANGCYERILLVASEAPLRAASPHAPDSSTLLGDGAGAVIVGRRPPSETYAFRHETWAEHINECHVKGGGHLLPAFEYTPARDADFRFHMDGPRLFRTALRRLPPLVERLLQDQRRTVEDVFFVPHQASPHAVEAMRRRLGVAPDRFLNRAQHFGNMAAASIPVLLDQLRRESLLPAGQSVCLLGTSAGYSQAGLLFTP